MLWHFKKRGKQLTQRGMTDWYCSEEVKDTTALILKRVDSNDAPKINHFWFSLSAIRVQRAESLRISHDISHDDQLEKSITSYSMLQITYLICLP
uniref:Ovule protein n=1 Tax=Steinernema glaseri TaxID=37863 RepID=A0A1I8AMP7_9BILA